jgi:cyclic beta-1,2-glucan synthetase
LAHGVVLRDSLEREGWDGRWYRRAFFDDGTALGTAAATECRIDSIAQSWSVISGAGNPERAQQAMQSVDEILIRRDLGLALLFTPPFDRSTPDPGYVQGYPPGLRENGGQYTHAAAWSVIAYAALGQGERAAELFAMLNPINHSSTRTALWRYKAEPYVVAADVYSAPAHVGRAGWTWYTGAAGWLYRAGLESILGFRRQGGYLELSPCIPPHWPHFEIVFRHASARYEIAVVNPDGVSRGVAEISVDGQALPAGMNRILLQDDGKTHQVNVRLG